MGKYLDETGVKTLVSAIKSTQWGGGNIANSAITSEKLAVGARNPVLLNFGNSGEITIPESTHSLLKSEDSLDVRIILLGREFQINRREVSGDTITMSALAYSTVANNRKYADSDDYNSYDFIMQSTVSTQAWNVEIDSSHVARLSNKGATFDSPITIDGTQVFKGKTSKLILTNHDYDSIRSTNIGNIFLIGVNGLNPCIARSVTTEDEKETVSLMFEQFICGKRNGYSSLLWSYADTLAVNCIADFSTNEFYAVWAGSNGGDGLWRDMISEGFLKGSVLSTDDVTAIWNNA